MAFGINLFDADGDLSYSSTDTTWNQVDFFSVSGGGYAQNTYPVLNGRDVLVLQVQINAPSLTQKATAFTITVSGTTIIASGGSEDTYIMVLMK
jgi:hypothetical protein